MGMGMGGMGEAAASYVKGGFTLFVGSLVSFIVMAVGSILVARMLTPAEYGLYGVSFVLPSFFLLFSNWGVDTALTRFVSRYGSEGRRLEIWRLIRVGLLFNVGVGVVLSLVLFLSADFLSVLVLRRPTAGEFVRLASLLVLFQSLYSTVISVLTGLERMDLRSAVGVFQAIVKGSSSPILVYMGFGVSGPLIGQVLSYFVASVVGVLLTFRSSPRPGEAGDASLVFRESLGLMLEFGLPLFFGGLLTGIAGRLQGFLLSWFVSDEAFGNYHVAMNFSMLVGLVTGSIAVTLFPAFSKLSHFLEPAKARGAFMGSVRYTSMLVIPLIILMATVSKPLIYVLYTVRYPDSPLYLVMMLAPTLLVGLGSLSMGNFFNSQGDTRTSMKIGLVGSIVSILLSPVLIWKWGVFGLLVTLIISSVIRNTFGVYVLRKRYGFHSDVRHTFKTLVCSAVTAAVSYGIIQFLPTSVPIFSLLLGSAVFFVVYLFLTPVTGVLDQQDISNLDYMLRAVPLVSFFALPLLGIERKILGFMSSKGDA